MNQYVNVNGNRKLFSKDVSKVIGGKAESCYIIKDGNGRLKCKGFGGSILRISYDIDTQEQVVVHICGFSVHLSVACPKRSWARTTFHYLFLCHDEEQTVRHS